jgi:hypothetical protein
MAGAGYFGDLNFHHCNREQNTQRMKSLIWYKNTDV